MTFRRDTLFCLLRLLLALLGLWVSTRVYAPLLAEQRVWLVSISALLAATVFGVELRARYRLNGRRPVRRVTSLVILTIALLALLHTGQQGFQLWWARMMVHKAPPQSLQLLGQHLVVGYNDLEEVRYLAGEGLIGGIYITSRNVQGRTTADVRAEILALQELREKRGLPPLWVMADQEGGMVSHLSPPLPLLNPLSAIVRAQGTPEQHLDAARAYGTLQGRQLAGLGVTINLAPVVDVDYSVDVPDDTYSHIRERTISSDPTVVRDIAGAYCSGLAQNNVRCTLKHFPGLGRVNTDTHVEAGLIDTELPELMTSDWIPFSGLMTQPGILTMVGHARLGAVDPELPASFSPGVLSMLRQQWAYQGLIITDDFCMDPVFASHLGVGGAAVSALNSGADLILISHDPLQYYPVMRALMRAQAGGGLRQAMLDQSARRLRQGQLMGASD